MSMTIEQAKTMLDEKFKEVKDLVSKANEQISNSDKMASDTKTELTNLVAKVDELQKNHQLLSKQGDALEIWAKRQNSEFEKKSKGFIANLEAEFEAKKDKIDGIVKKTEIS